MENPRKWIFSFENNGFIIFAAMMCKVFNAKRTVAMAIIACLLFVASCKESNYSQLIGNWAFQGNSYSPTLTVVSGKQLTASTASDSSQVILSFTSLPVLPGTYRVVSPADTTPGNNLSVQMILDGGYYKYASTGSGNVTARVSLSTFGKISISIPSVEVASTTNSSDTAAITYLFVNQQ